MHGMYITHTFSNNVSIINIKSSQPQKFLNYLFTLLSGKSNQTMLGFSIGE